MKVFLLEDDVLRIKWFKEKLKNHELTVVSNAGEAIYILSKSDYGIIFLDHDLEGKAYVNSSYHNTGFTVAKYLKDVERKSRVIVHSLNPVGARNIKTSYLMQKLCLILSYKGY